MDPAISEIKYFGEGRWDFLEVRVPVRYPDPENLRLVIYKGATTASPAARDLYNVTTDGLLYTEDTDGDGNDDDGILHYTFGSSESGDNVRLNAEDAVGLYNVATGETYGLYNWSGSPYTVSTTTGDPFAGQTATLLDNTGQVYRQTSLELQRDGTFALQTDPTPGESFLCFAKGTLILTPTGERPVETLCIGDPVVTKDGGAKHIRWVGSRCVTGLSSAHTTAQPITIKAHAFGPNIPNRDTQLSPNHAVLNDHWKASLYFGEEEVLAPAKSLLSADYAHQCRVPEVHYFHILLDQHSLVMANRLWAETLFLGSECMKMLAPHSCTEIFAQMPEIGGMIQSYGPKVRQELTTREGRVLV